MRSRNWSDVVLAAMIALCVNVAVESKGVRDPGASANDASHENVADAAQALAVAVLWDTRSTATVHQDQHGSSTPSLQNDAIGEAAQVAGQVASEIEMPFFSFGGNAAAE